MKTATVADTEAFERACRYDRRLRAVAQMVDVLTEFVRPDDVMCAGCVWKSIVKPLVTPFIGWERGEPLRSATPPLAASEPVNVGDLLDEPRGVRIPATTDEEKWLRSAEAYDAFTCVLLDRLDRADPANGHGIGRPGGES